MQLFYKVVGLICLCLTIYLCPHAQPNITRVEYFIDTDPGMGLGTAAAITPGTNLANQTISFDPTALAPGVHIFGMRSRNTNGAWSHTNYLAFVKAFPALPAEPAVTNITRVEYFIDTDPGMGLATATAITPGTNLANQTISFDPTALAPGVHIFGVRSRNANGAWSHTNYLAFAKPFPALPTEPPAGNLQQIEYFIDADPGMGNGIPVAFGAGKLTNDAIGQINVTGLAVGSHTLGWRSMQANGAWSHTVLLDFSVPAAIAAPAIVVNSVSKMMLCANDSLEVGLHLTGNYNAGNTFLVQLSDANGSFANPILLRSLNGVANQVIKLKLPAHLPDGTGYKLRINSTNPVVTGSSGNITLTIRDRPYAATITGRNFVNGTYTWPYSIPNVATSTFNWLITGGTQASGTNTNTITTTWAQPTGNSAIGNLRVIETNQYGCVGDTSILSPVIIYKLDIGDTVAASICKTETLIIKTGSTGSFEAGNNLIAELSDANGSFTAPTASATIPFTGNGINQPNTISLPIPANLPNGIGYRVRVRSTVPAFVGDTTANINIVKPDIGADRNVTYCDGYGYNLRQHYIDIALSYGYFTNEFAPVPRPDSVQAGVYEVIGTNSNGCKDTAQVSVTANPSPSLGADTTVYHLCLGETTNLQPLYTTTGITAVWNTGNPTAAIPGIYRLVVTNSFSCTDTAFATVVLQTATWTGTLSSDWHNAGNWSTGKVPTEKTHVILNPGTPNRCVISTANGIAASVQARNGSSIQTSNGKTLLIQGKCGTLPGN